METNKHFHSTKIHFLFFFRERDAEAFAKQSEEERLMLENQALEAAKKELLRKEHERAEKRKMGYFAQLIF